jgi:hypothetical protein
MQHPRDTQTIDVDGDVQLQGYILDLSQTALVVGTTTTHVDGDLVLSELLDQRLHGADNPLEGGRHVGEVLRAQGVNNRE